VPRGGEVDVLVVAHLGAVLGALWHTRVDLSSGPEICAGSGQTFFLGALLAARAVLRRPISAATRRNDAWPLMEGGA
jgi:hypothetical protein